MQTNLLPQGCAGKSIRELIGTQDEFGTSVDITFADSTTLSVRLRHSFEVTEFNADGNVMHSGMRVLLKRNLFNRWILVKAENSRVAWSGSNWVPIYEDGMPSVDIQVSNLETREAAARYAATFRFEVV